ncbi:MAG: hypothetical protein AB8F74_21040 [Saprospiraceae bacterium]
MQLFKDKLEEVYGREMQLVNYRVSWKDYPYLGEGKESIALTSMTIHVLNIFNYREFNFKWASKLNIKEIGIDEEENNKIWYKSEEEKQREDTSAYFIFPWSIKALFDVVRYGNEKEKKIACNYINQIIGEMDLYESSNSNSY